MKIRSGFVSNSSSSSFVIVGNELTWREVLENKGTKSIWCIGDYICDGQDYFELTDEMVESIRLWNHAPNCTPIEVFDDGSGELGLKLKKDTLPDEFTIYSIEKDYHCTDDNEEFVRMYLE